MPKTSVVFFRNLNGSVPTKIWIDEVVAKRDRRAVAKLAARINILRTEGRNVRRPIADFLQKGIYELRAEFGGVNYRLLYFYVGDQVVISHGCTKEAEVPLREIEFAIRNRDLFESDPERYTYEGEI